MGGRRVAGGSRLVGWQVGGDCPVGGRGKPKERRAAAAEWRGPARGGLGAGRFPPRPLTLSVLLRRQRSARTPHTQPVKGRRGGVAPPLGLRFRRVLQAAATAPTGEQQRPRRGPGDCDAEGVYHGKGGGVGKVQQLGASPLPPLRSSSALAGPAVPPPPATLPSIHTLPRRRRRCGVPSP